MNNNKLYRYLLQAIFLITFTNVVYATNYTVSVKNDLINRMVAAVPGDTVIVANGTYNWDLVSFVNANGSASLSPIVLKAQTPGLVVFNGTTKFSFQITNMVFTGFVFKNGQAAQSSVIKVGKGPTAALSSYYCRITNNVIDNYNSDTSLGHKNAWIELDGAHHRVDHNTFINKSNGTATVIVVYEPATYPAKSPSTFNRIDSNYFKGRSYMGTNEGETIRVGDASVARSNGYNVVEFNLIEDVITSGEIEILSNKSQFNTYRYNTIKNSNGGICLRFGRYCNVYGNFILRDNPATTAAGIRIIDKGHKVFNNYIEGVNGAGLSSDQKRASICMYNGNFSDSALGSGEYFAADSCLVAFNTIVNAESGAGVALGCVHGGSIQPKGIKLANNIVKMTTGNALYMNAANTSITYSSEGNIYDATAIGVTTTGWQNNTLLFGARTNGILTAPAVVQDAAINSASYASLLSSIDAQGQTRSAVFDAGADELNGTGTVIYYPLSYTQVGALFYVSALPVQLINFSVQKVDSNIKLFWDVANEINLKAYVVEWSTDGRSFTALTSIDAKGLSKASYAYSHVVVSNNNYYRIKMVDKDGSFAYSPIKMMSSKTAVAIKLYPNPANTSITIESNKNITGTIRIINSLGMLQHQVNNANFNIGNTISISVRNMPNGMYYAEFITNTNEHFMYPFIISTSNK